MGNKEAELASFLARCRTANQKQDQKQAQPDLHAGAPKEAKGPATVEELVRQARAAGHTGPLVLGPPRSSLKQDSWRNDAKWLEENCPDEFGPPRLPISESLGSLPAPLSVPVQELVVIAPESPQSVPEVPPALSPIPPLPASWWQGLLYGSPDAMLSAADATRAMHLIAQALLVERGLSEFSEGVRVVALRKLLEAHFGAAQAWQAMHGLWHRLGRM
jgi:hypothetical protein